MRGAGTGRTIAINTARTLAAVATGLVLLAGCTSAEGQDRTQDTAEEKPVTGPFQPSEDDPDPSERIEGVETAAYQGGLHADPGQRVAYDRRPPFGGAHAPAWATCTGIVYDRAVRTENMVHSLEHGAVWIAYHPERVTGAELDKLKDRVDGQPYLMLSPYPGLDRPISLQSWGHQLKLDSADDQRIDQFIQALRANPYTTPEPGASCAIDPRAFDPTNPPPFDPSEPGPNAMPVTGD